MSSFQKILLNLSQFWKDHGCILVQGYDLEVGAGTFNPATFLRCLGPEPFNAAYVEPCRRPSDGRYGENPNRTQHYFQYQVVLKPSPQNIQDLYLKSLQAMGFDLSKHDIRFVHDDWESPTLGASGLGWEVWMDGMEVTQFTYFQTLGGQELYPVTGEITYGLERLALYLQKVNSFFELSWSETVSYKNLYHRNEVEWSRYNFEEANVEMWFRHFNDYETEAIALIEKKLPLPSYDFVMKASHAFNLLDARGAISVTERARYIGRIRNLSKMIAASYVESREKLGFPMLEKEWEASKVELPLLRKETYMEGKKEDFILEIGSEELPATFVDRGAASLERQVKALLEKENLSYESITCTGTPRRLVLMIEQLQLGTARKKLERRGPALQSAYDENGSPTKASAGFFRSLKREPVDLNTIKNQQANEIEIRQLKGKEYLFAQVDTPSRFASSILSENLPKIILNLEFPKQMHWGIEKITYARPIKWLLALLGDYIVPMSVGNIASSNTSFGHRQLNPEAIVISKTQDYFEALRDKNVMVKRNERVKQIERQICSIEKEYEIIVTCKNDVMKEVVNLSEWPQLSVVQFDKRFLKLPKEVLNSEMVEHQKYFPTETSSGEATPYFIITCDNNPSEEIRKGNLKVLSARLSDGDFLYHQDLKTNLNQLNTKLKTVTHLEKLGSIWDKVERLQKHTQVIHKKLQLGNLEPAMRAAKLCKADLASQMVDEFPDLQGTMGRYYAIKSGEVEKVALAIEEHYLPSSESGPLPETDAGIIVAIADKIDNLIACYALGLKPTSSSDPYALRRQTLGIIKILLKTRKSFPIKDAISACAKHFPKAIVADPEGLSKEIWLFFQNRIRSVFMESPKIGKDAIEASLSLGKDDIHSQFSRILALSKFRETPAFDKLIEVYKRARGQLNQGNPVKVNPNLFGKETEKNLWKLLEKVEPEIRENLSLEKYERTYELLASLQIPLANLFDDVRILVDDLEIQGNRLGLLKRVLSLFETLIDFSKIVQKSTKGSL